MARARNTVEEVTEATETQFDEAVLSGEDLGIDAIEAAMNGEGDMELEIDDKDFSDIDDHALTVAIQADESREKAYDNVESTVNVADEDDVKASEEAEKPKTVRPSGPAGGKARDPETFADEAIACFGDAENMVLDSDVGQLSEEDMRGVLSTLSQIKVREKTLNLIRAVVSGGKLNGYSKTAIDLLIAASNNGEMLTVQQIKSAYESAGYKPGTVAAQAGQLMTLLPALQMAKKTTVRGQIDPNPSSVFLNVLMTI